MSSRRGRPPSVPKWSLLNRYLPHGEREDDAVVGNGLGELGYIREPFYEGLAFGSETYTE